MSIFKKKIKKTKDITFSAEDARAMVEGKYTEAFNEIRNSFWINVKKRAMEGKSNFSDYEFLYSDTSYTSHNLGKNAVTIYKEIEKEFKSLGFETILTEEISNEEDFANQYAYLIVRKSDRVKLTILWDKKDEDNNG